VTRTLVLVIALVACKKTEKQPPPPIAPPAIDAAAVAPPVDADPFDPGELATPESVLYDEGRDMYIVANINGKSDGADDNGFLVNVNPDGSNERANANFRWIDGSAADIKLDAPKGMAISGETLYVADLTVVRRFEAKAGKQKDDVKIDGAVFLNDVVTDGKGGVFVSDSDDKVGAVYHVDKDGTVKLLIKAPGANGLVGDGKGGVWVVTGTGEIFDVDGQGKQGAVQKLPTGALDGIVAIDGGDFAVTSWECKCVYRGKPGGEWTVIVKDVEGPADLAYDSKRKRLVIPNFTTSKLTLHQL
jgi:hypothetical protein